MAISALDAADDLATVRCVVGDVVVLSALRMRIMRKRREMIRVEIRSWGRRPQWSV